MPSTRLDAEQIRDLRACPNLKTIFFLDSSPFDPNVDWCSQRVSGIKITSYVNPQYRQEEFFDCRRLVLIHSATSPRYPPLTFSTPQSERMPYTCKGIGVDCHWEFQSYYKGFQVPEGVLRRVYECAGLRGRMVPVWSGGRGLKLPDEAWRCLRRWREIMEEVRDSNGEVEVDVDAWVEVDRWAGH